MGNSKSVRFVRVLDTAPEMTSGIKSECCFGGAWVSGSVISVTTPMPSLFVRAMHRFLLGLYWREYSRENHELNYDWDRIFGDKGSE